MKNYFTRPIKKKNPRRVGFDEKAIFPGKEMKRIKKIKVMI